MAAPDFCHSCTAPLSLPQFKGRAEAYCVHCTDANGNLLPKEQIQRGISMWFKGWQGNVPDEVLFKRAGEFMKGLPAWTPHN